MFIVIIRNYPSKHKTFHICITFVQQRANGFDFGSTLYKCHTNVFYLQGYWFGFIYFFPLPFGDALWFNLVIHLAIITYLLSYLKQHIKPFFRKKSNDDNNLWLHPNHANRVYVLNNFVSKEHVYVPCATAWSIIQN